MCMPAVSARTVLAAILVASLSGLFVTAITEMRSLGRVRHLVDKFQQLMSLLYTLECFSEDCVSQKYTHKVFRSATFKFSL